MTKLVCPLFKEETIKFDPHEEMSFPACWMNANESGFDSRCNIMMHNRIYIVVSMEFLKTKEKLQERST